MILTNKILYINVGMTQKYNIRKEIEKVIENLSDSYLYECLSCPSHTQNGILYHKVYLTIVGNDKNGYKKFKHELKKLFGYECKLY